MFTRCVKLLIVSTLLLAACQGEVAVPVEQTPPPAEPSEEPAPTLGPPTETQVTIDGQSDDWERYEVIGGDRSGDQVPGSPDLAEIRAFSNDQYFYLLIVLHEDGETDHYDVQIDVDGGDFDYQLSVWPERNEAVFAAFPPTSMSPLAGVTAAQDEVIEVKMPLSAIGGQPVQRVFVQTFLGDQAGDTTGGPLTAIVANETEPAVAQEPPSVDQTLARHFGLPEGYIAERLFEPPAPDLVGIARSESGLIYLIHGGLSSGISTLDVTTGEVTRILDLPTSEGWYSAIVGGPDDTAFIPMAGEIWQVHPDGFREVWAQSPYGQPTFYMPDGRLLIRSHNGTRVLELSADGSSREIGAGFGGVYDIVGTEDGTVFVSDIETGDITRIDPDGTQRVLAESLLYRDPMDMAIDPDGNLFLNTVATGFVQVDMETGELTHYDSAHSPCGVHQADFAFDASGRAVFVDPTWSVVTWADLSTGETGLLVGNEGANTSAAAIGPDDALYVGVWGCGDEIPGQVVRITDDSEREVYVDGLRGQVQDIAFAPDGGLYLATHEPGVSFPVFYVPPEGGDPVQIPGVEGASSLTVDPLSGHLLVAQGGSTILELTPEGLVATYTIESPREAASLDIAAAPDGTLYAYAAEAERFWTGPQVERWVLRLDLESGTSEIVFQFDREGCCVMGNLSADPQGTLWWMVNPEFIIYSVTPDGEGTLFAQNLPIDPAAVVADSEGDVYFTSPGGIYRIYQVP